jgi:transcriptional regulator with GAF, ATPase, and Fis domain/tetratricopeptide (TPR) repeat protein
MSMDRDFGQPERQPKRTSSNGSSHSDAALRLKEIGDLHFEASAFSSALDYYQKLLDIADNQEFSPVLSLRVLRKSMDAALNIGDLILMEELLHRAFQLLETNEELSSDERQHELAPILGRQACLFTQRSAYKDALRVAKHAFAVLAITDDHLEVANLQVTMGVCHHRLGRMGKAEEFYNDALATYRRIDDKLGMAILYNNLALLLKNACRWDRALDYQQKSIRMADAHGATHLLARLCLNEGIILRKSERHGEARASFEKCLRLSRSLGDVDRQAKVNLALGHLEMLDGHLVRAEELILEGKHLSDQAGFLREATIADEYMGDILIQRGEYDSALYNYGLGLEKTRTLGTVTDLEGELLRRCAHAYLLQGDMTRAVESAEAALAVCSSCGEDYEIGFCHETLGAGLLALDRPVEAENHFKEAISVFQGQNLPIQACESILGYLDAMLDEASQETLMNLRRLLNEALEGDGARRNDDLFSRLQVGLAEIQIRLGQLDEAMLTVCEIERILGSQGGGQLNKIASRLRLRIEKGLMGEGEDLEEHLSAVSSISGFVRGNGDPELDLTPVLRSSVIRTGADCGFIALLDDHDEIDVTACEQLSAELASQTSAWYVDRHHSGQITGPVLVSQLDHDHDLVRHVPHLAVAIRSCLIIPVALQGELRGVMCLGLTNDAHEGLSLKPSLELLSTSMGFLALALTDRRYAFEERRGRAMVMVQERVDCFDNIITGNSKMLEMLGLVTRVAPSELTVLVHGATGTGKGLLAYSIHALSRRAKKRFLAINCSAIPEALLESELFGHVKGSFTGAYTDKKGLLAEAEGGTVFLDEIGKLPLSMQGKLLHFLDTKIVRPVGSNEEHRVDVRIVCATKRDLRDRVDASEFLEDLYYRLADFPIQVPPLKDRADDIPMLAPYFIERYVKDSDMALPGMTAAFLDALVRYDWPGNVRELEKALNRAIVLANGDNMLRLEYLPPVIAGQALDRDSGQPVQPLRETIQAVEAREITQALKVTGGNKSHTARLLGISYPSLLKKVRLYGISQSS